MDILNFPGWIITGQKENDRDYFFEVEYDSEGVHCPHCSCFLLDKHGLLEKQVMDTPIHGKRVGVLLRRRRFKCKNCGKTLAIRNNVWMRIRIIRRGREAPVPL